MATTVTTPQMQPRPPPARQTRPPPARGNRIMVVPPIDPTVQLRRVVTAPATPSSGLSSTPTSSPTTISPNTPATPTGSLDSLQKSGGKAVGPPPGPPPKPPLPPLTSSVSTSPTTEDTSALGAMKSPVKDSFVPKSAMGPPPVKTAPFARPPAASVVIVDSTEEHSTGNLSPASPINLSPPSTVPPSASSPTFESDETRKNRIRTHVATEIMTTEKSYVLSLQNLCTLYINPLKSALQTDPIITAENLRLLFSNLELITGFNENFLKQITECVDKWSESQKLGHLFMKMAPFFKMYTQYMENHDAASDLLSKLEKSNSRFQAFCKTAMANPLSQNLSLASFLIMPIQRIPRYQLLLRELVTNTDQSHPDYAELNEALTTVSGVATHINESIRKHQARQEMLTLQESFTGNLTLITPSRVFIRQGPLIKKSRKSDITYEFFLFNDCLLYAKKVLGAKKYKLHKEIKINKKFMVFDRPEKDPTDGKKPIYKFEIKSTAKSFVVYTYDQEEKNAWFKDLLTCQQNAHSSSKKKKDDEEGEIVPVWQADNQSTKCSCCKRTFGLINRRHHCRYCGLLVCHECSLKRMINKKMSDPKPQRVCDKCVREIKGGSAPGKRSDKPRESLTESTNSNSSIDTQSVEEMDEKTKAATLAATKSSTSIIHITDAQEAEESDEEGGSLNSAPSGDTTMGEKCKAVFAYRKAESGDLEFDEGDVITVTTKDPSGWWRGIHSITGEEGIFPANYVAVIVDGSEAVAPPQLDLYMTASSDYEATNDVELTIKKSDVIHVTSEDNSAVWYYGTNERTTKAGWFPSKFVNETTKSHVNGLTSTPIAMPALTSTTSIASTPKGPPTRVGKDPPRIGPFLPKLITDVPASSTPTSAPTPSGSQGTAPTSTSAPPPTPTGVGPPPTPTGGPKPPIGGRLPTGRIAIIPPKNATLRKTITPTRTAETFSETDTTPSASPLPSKPCSQCTSCPKFVVNPFRKGICRDCNHSADSH